MELYKFYFEFKSVKVFLLRGSKHSIRKIRIEFCWTINFVTQFIIEIASPSVCNDD